MNEPSWPVVPVSGHIVVDVDVLVQFGSINWKVVWIGWDSAIAAIAAKRVVHWSPREASDLSERMESNEITEDVSERFGETMWPSPLPGEETMRFAMR